MTCRGPSTGTLVNIKADNKVILLHGGLADPFHEGGGVLHV